ncbi:MAG: PD40 domain-containing protein [Acidobacteria bacterium]|nr:PD40 domain-containing protein [Acidobacteriota bacterium]
MKTGLIPALVLPLICLLGCVCGHAQPTAPAFPQLSGPYLGQTPPGTTPAIFAPGIISTDLSEGCSGWGNDMDYFIFQRWIDGQPHLYIMERTDDRWIRPAPLPFVEKYRVGDYTIAPDGKTLVFASSIFLEEFGSEGEGANIWRVVKTAGGWTEPKPLPAPVNTRYHDSYPCLAGNGNIYFFSRRPGGVGQSDLYMAEFSNGRYGPAVNLGPVLNTEHHEWDTYIAPDESYMIYCSTMPGGRGDDDLYVTFRRGDGSWGKPVHLGGEINSDQSENRPTVTPDGKYLFFTSTRRGNRDIYWVDARVIHDLKPEE